VKGSSDFCVLPVLVGAVAQHLRAVALGCINGNLHFGKLPAMPCKNHNHAINKKVKKS
jgi:hypothetical protein